VRGEEEARGPGEREELGQTAGQARGEGEEGRDPGERVGARSAGRIKAIGGC